MADYDRRPRRGGGQFNNRKRRYRDDDYDDRRPQRRRYEDPPAIQVRKQVLLIAESPHKRAEDEVANIAKQIAENYFDTDLTNAFLDLSVKLTLEQPLKIPFLAAIVLVTNTQKPEFTEEVLKKVADALQANIKNGCWREVKLLLRFLACLQGLFMGDGIFPFLEELFNRAAELQMKDSDDALGLELVKIILFSIAYTMASSAEGYESQASSLLERTEIITSQPHPLENLVDPYPSAEPGAPTSHESTLSLMQKHMTQESQRGWQLPCLPRPWNGVRQNTEGEDLLATAQKYPFPSLQLPEKLQIGPRPIFPDIYLSVYLGQEMDTVPTPEDPSALLIRDALADTVNSMDFNRNIAGKSLIDLDCYFTPDTFVKRATPFDKLAESSVDRNAWKPEDVVVDAVFASLLQLPGPEHKPVYYHSVLTESCKIAPAAVAPSLGRAIRYLYRNVDRMDLELAHRFLDWFAHHLSNFGFTWKWTEWIDDVELSNVHPKKAFIIDALDKEMRLSFAQRIQGTLPDQYHSLIAPEKFNETPEFKYADPSTPFAEEGQDLMQKLRQRASDEEIDAVLAQIEEAATTSGLSNPKLAAIDAYTTTITHIGNKSLSHALAMIERNLTRLSALANENPEYRKQIITSITTYWQWQTGTAVFLLDKLLNYGVLTPDSVIEWALIDHIDRGTLLAKAWCYELITRTLNKVVGRVRQVVHKMRDPRMTDEERATLKEVLDKEMATMKGLFAAVEDAVTSVASASEDGMMESSDALRAEEEGELRKWGGKWVRWVRRRGAVEESWVREELERPLPEVPVVEEMDEVKEENENGNENGVKIEEDGEGRNGGRDGERAGDL